MIRGTTPQHTFLFPFDPATCSEIIVTYQQKGIDVLEKTLPDMTIDSTANTVSYRLTQEETLGFDEGFVRLQVKAKVGNNVMASAIMNVPATEILNEEVI